ncbi:hypothetical protein [Candidatus Blochmanniella vafra]|uniref:hypothetical protein n=1 Tax=Candidatus Blochmanniella vafra TaxID=251535 RepID=UPI0002D5E21D|nr:hypothetical protein [Candidatus Blochmannia vafer]
MIARIPKTLIETLISRTNIVDLINQRIPLKKKAQILLLVVHFTQKNTHLLL